ncbi:MAG: hypothetical protein R1F52_04465 [Candidatus Nitrosoabyssus spongiisocia]|nr:MAG: hypothetical protein R1F52_04465 [Nitrosopumilaceae archaeon AB1(1)]
MNFEKYWYKLKKDTNGEPVQVDTFNGKPTAYDFKSSNKITGHPTESGNDFLCYYKFVSEDEVVFTTSVDGEVSITKQQFEKVWNDFKVSDKTTRYDKIPSDPEIRVLVIKHLIEHIKPNTIE